MTQVDPSKPATRWPFSPRTVDAPKLDRRSPTVLARDRYLAGVPCWVDLLQPEPERTEEFYRGLFGWEYEVRTPPGAPMRYSYAVLDGLTVGGIGGPSGAGTPEGWTTYVCVDSADATAAAVQANGGKVLAAPDDVGESGRVAVFADPRGAVFGAWQPAQLPGAQLVNAPGSWNFSGLETTDLPAAKAFYRAVFGWEPGGFGWGEGESVGFWRVAGYGDFLAQRDPEIRERQAEDQAPGDFADAVATYEAKEPEAGRGPDRWTVTFAVADADAAFERALGLGAEVVVPLFDTEYTRQGVIADPQGAELGLSQYRPPAG
jgi:uncharacterized protein